MTNLWRWISVNWGPLGIGTCIGYVLGVVSNVLKWRWPSWEDFKQERQGKRNRNLDAKVLQSLTDLKMPRSSGGMTGAGMPLNRISEIAAYLEEDRDDVEESLSRLELRRRIRSDREYWFLMPD